MTLTLPPSIRTKQLSQGIREFAETYPFQLFITLATNSYGSGHPPMLDLYKAWDARVNRALLGRRWAKKKDKRLVIFATLEKPTKNPHWHLLVSIQEDPPKRDQTRKRLHTLSGEIWETLCPRGTTDVQEIWDQAGIIKYVAKELDNPLQFESLVLPGQFAQH